MTCSGPYFFEMFEGCPQAQLRVREETWRHNGESRMINRGRVLGFST